MRKMRKICIIGFSQASRDLAPDTDDYEYWGMNHLYPYVDRPWSLWFEMHSRAYMQQHLAHWDEYDAWLQQPDAPHIMMQDAYPVYPSSVRMPIESMNDAAFHAYNRSPYYASTVAYAIAYAIWLHRTGPTAVHTLAVYGIDMVKDTEYEYQRPNCEYLLGLATGLGIRVEVPTQSALLQSPWLYGYQEVPIHLFSGLEREGVDRIKGLTHEVEQRRRALDNARAEYHTYRGALQEQQYAIQRLRDIRRGAAYGDAIPSQAPEPGSQHEQGPKQEQEQDSQT